MDTALYKMILLYYLLLLSVDSNQKCNILLNARVVEDLGTAPNCLGSILCSTAGLT